MIDIDNIYGKEDKKLQIIGMVLWLIVGVSVIACIVTEGKNGVYTGSYMPMSIKDGRNKSERYKYNGEKKYSAPFAYGMILEITYLRKSRVIDRIDVVQ